VTAGLPRRSSAANGRKLAVSTDASGKIVSITVHRARRDLHLQGRRLAKSMSRVWRRRTRTTRGMLTMVNVPRRGLSPSVTTVRLGERIRHGEKP